MNCLISHLTKKQRGGYARRDQEVAGEVVRFGRGADCEVHLPDPRVLLHHAEVVARPGGYFVEAAGQGEVLVNGTATAAAKLKVGDRIGIGPYEVVVVEAPQGHDLALTVELIRPLGDDLAALKERSHLTLTAVGLGKRGWSWLLFLVVAAVFLALPVYGFFAKPLPDKAALLAGTPSHWPNDADTVWLSGEISGAHKFFGMSCEACHQEAFVQVKDGACLTCHDTIQHHADPAHFQLAAFANRCESCHKEHNGNQSIVLQDQAFCVSCHADLKQQAPTTTLLNVSDFGRGHPEFRPTVLVDAAAGRSLRVPLDAQPKPQEQSNLKFPHDKHLVEKGVRHPDRGLIQLDCQNCHVQERGGIGMRPINFERDCQSCHSLRFEPSDLDRQLPHGVPAEALKMLVDYYAARALQGGLAEEGAPAVVRRRPGQPLAEAERLEALAWAEAKAQQVGDRVFGRSVCGSCHVVTGGNGNWQVAKVTVVDSWLPKGKFVHGEHEPMACTQCHAARKSEQSSDVLLPGIAVCQTCHGGESATAQVPSTCIDCHEFHQPGLAAMRAPVAAAVGK